MRRVSIITDSAPNLKYGRRKGFEVAWKLQLYRDSSWSCGRKRGDMIFRQDKVSEKESIWWGQDREEGRPWKDRELVGVDVIRAEKPTTEATAEHSVS